MGSVGLFGLVWQVAMSATVAAFGVFAFKMYRMRIIFYKLKKQGLPMPEWDFAAGNLKTLPGLLDKFPKGSQQSDAFSLLSHDFKENDNCFYIDLWPFTSPDRVMLESTPHIIEEAEVYVALLREHAKKGDTFSLDRLTCDYMMDLIGAITINARLHSMTGHNDLAAAMRSSIEWHCQDEEMNPFKRWNPMRPLIEWHNGKTMDRYINAELDKRYEDWRTNEPATRAKSVMDIAIAAYMGERKASEKLDAQFKKWATTQIRLFLFAGHDSTAATIVYSFHMLSKHPEALAKIRAEHDEVFGEDIDSVVEILKKHPEQVNKLPYTTAVIKETLRLFPPASGMRGGRPGVFLQDKNGTRYPTEGLNIWVVHGAIQRNPNYWPEPHHFIPERWLVEPGHPLYPPKGGWRPFEFGPRNCLGQTLAMLDIKITLAMTVREFDVKDQYDEWDRLHPSSGIKTVFGERAYQVPQGAAHPVHGFPCKVTSRRSDGKA
ncbi:hypothetical protein CFE70_007395 [Pyrenophora teres f. teres 0-1]